MDGTEDFLPEYDALEGETSEEKIREELENPELEFEELDTEEQNLVRGYYGESVRNEAEELHPESEDERTVSEGLFYGMLHANTHEDLSGSTVVHEMAEEYRRMAQEFNRYSRNMRKAVDQEVPEKVDSREVAESVLRIQDVMFEKRREWNRRGLPTPPVEEEVGFMRRTLADPIEEDLHKYLL